MCFWNTDLSVHVSGVGIMAKRTRGMWKHMTLHLTSYSYTAPSGPADLIPNWGQYRAHDPDDQRTKHLWKKPSFLFWTQWCTELQHVMVWDITVWIFYADLCTSEVCVAIFHIVHMPANKSEWHCFSIYFYAVHDWHVLWSPFCCHFPFCVFSDAPSASLWIHPLSHPPFAKKSECPLS